MNLISKQTLDTVLEPSATTSTSPLSPPPSPFPSLPPTKPDNQRLRDLIPKWAPSYKSWVAYARYGLLKALTIQAIDPALRKPLTLLFQSLGYFE